MKQFVKTYRKIENIDKTYNQNRKTYKVNKDNFDTYLECCRRHVTTIKNMLKKPAISHEHVKLPQQPYLTNNN